MSTKRSFDHSMFSDSFATGATDGTSTGFTDKFDAIDASTPATIGLS